MAKQSMNTFTIFLTAAVVVVMLLSEPPCAEAAVTCNPMGLSLCLGALSSSTTSPTNDCCAKLTEQQPCFCGYIKNPFYKPYVESPNAKRVAAACGVQTPTCT